MLTDIDDRSLKYARQNVELNELTSRVKLLKVAPDEPLIPQEMLDHIPSDIDFTMVNPPFYASASELLASAAMKSRPPSSACTGAEVEMIYPAPPTLNGANHDPGGELGFALRLLTQSNLPEVRHRIQWFLSFFFMLST